MYSAKCFAQMTFSSRLTSYGHWMASISWCNWQYLKAQAFILVPYQLFCMLPITIQCTDIEHTLVNTGYYVNVPYFYP